MANDRILIKNLAIFLMVGHLLVAVQSVLATEINLTKIALTPHNHIVKKFSKTVTFETEESNISSIIFGNGIYGYFKTNNFKRIVHGETNTLIVELIPPGYRYPLDFYGLAENHPVLLMRGKILDSPITGLLKHFTAKLTFGNSTQSNFFIVGGGFPSIHESDLMRFNVKKIDAGSTNFVAVLNNIGEVIWLHFPNGVFKDQSGYIIAKQTSDGNFAVMDSKRSGGYFEILTPFGEIIKSFSPKKDLPQKFSIHHDFVLHDNKLISFSSNNKYLRDPRKIWSTMEPFRGDRIISVDLEHGRMHPIWDAYDWFNPILLRPDQYKWDQMFKRLHVKPIKNDFLHANSIDFKNGVGWLVSLRNINSVALYSEDFTQLKWISGDPEFSTRPLMGQKFLKQHHVSFTGNKTFMVFDNGKWDSRIVEIEVDDEKSEIIWEFSPELPILSKIHGSAYRVGKNVVAYFPNSQTGELESRNHRPKTPDDANKLADYISSLIEVDYKSKEIIAKLEIHSISPSGSYRAYPFESFGQTTYLGRNVDLTTH